MNNSMKKNIDREINNISLIEFIKYIIIVIIFKNKVITK